MATEYRAILLAVLTASALNAQSDIILEIGAAPSWDLPGLAVTVSPTIAIEFTPIEHWLEIEIGTAPTFTHHSTTWSTDLLFKKPWTLSKKLEFMIGAGPQWIHAKTNSVAAEAVLDFMFWPGPKRKFGWYFEPEYDYEFGHGHEKSIGFSAGLLIKIR